MTKDNTEHLRQRRLLSTEARNTAIQRLKDAHPEEYRALYEEEAAKRGIKTFTSARKSRIARLRAELEAELARLKETGASAGEPTQPDIQNP